MTTIFGAHVENIEMKLCSNLSHFHEIFTKTFQICVFNEKIPLDPGRNSPEIASVVLVFCTQVLIVHFVIIWLYYNMI